MRTEWTATHETGLTVRLTYADVAARIHATPASERVRLGDGAMVLGAWVVRRGGV